MLLRMDDSTKQFLEQVRSSMVVCFGPDQRRIDHALQVTEYARELLQYIDADPLLTLTAAYLHDIGIPEAEKKHGHCSGKMQEIEGPPIARKLLQKLNADSELINEVCSLVGNHHTPAGIDSPEFRILWDADALVNLKEIIEITSAEKIETILQKSLVTEPGYRRARAIYL